MTRPLACAARGVAMLLLVGSLAGTEAAAAQATDQLAELLAAETDEGAPLISPESRRYVDGLPQHAVDLIGAAVADEKISSASHLAAILGLEMSTSTLEIAMGDNCFLCHSNPDFQGADTLFSPDPEATGSSTHMSLASVVRDVHFRRGLSCAGCHGGDPSEAIDHDFPASWPTDTEQRHTDRAWIPEFCGRCHSDSAFMRRFDPSLPTDQVQKYRESRHGALLAAGDSRAAQCVSCHGVHGIQSAKSPRSMVYPKRVPETCGACHADPEHMRGYTLDDGSPLPTDQLDQYRHSVHGRALLERGDLGAPACNDCHGNHAAMPPQVASVAQICRTCHARNGTLFDGSRHKQVFEAHGWPECDVCHGKHDISRTSDAMLAPGPEGLCGKCHAQYAANNPECNATATYFRATLMRLSNGYGTLREQTEHFARQGLDVEPMDDELDTLFDSLKQSRSYIHSFDRSEFQQVAAVGDASIARVAELETEAQAELRYRRTGLSVSVGLLVLLMLAIYLKLRRFESRHRG